MCRLFIWLCLGPWYRIYSEIFVPKQEDIFDLKSDDARLKRHDDILNNVQLEFEEKGRQARICGEDALKMQSMRKFRFGDFIAKVPRMYLARHYDFPLSDSKAAHASLNPQYKIPPPHFEARTVIALQQLDGKMIPLTENEKESTKIESDETNMIPRTENVKDSTKVEIDEINEERTWNRDDANEDNNDKPSLAPVIEHDSSNSDTSLSEFLTFHESASHELVPCEDEKEEANVEVEGVEVVANFVEMRRSLLWRKQDDSPKYDNTNRVYHNICKLKDM